MRELKFRAWHKANKQILPVCDISFGDDGSALTIIFQTAPKEKYYRGLVNGENGILMQFTGLHDRSDKEIYEGDIVMWNIYPEDKDTITVIDVVEFSRGLFATKARHQILATIEPYRKLEVIGNIYENPELLDTSH
jgi:uncharacterized phage protein (TIGR01671 family)